MDDYLKKLNKAQYEAVTTTSKYARVIAGAGSGKTRVLTSRIIYLITQLGISSRSILAITFTNKAANEMKNRVEVSLENKSAVPLISTFHSLCVRFLREEIKVIGYPSSFTIVDDDDQDTIIKKILKDLDIAKDTLNPRQAKSYISYHKSAGVGVEEAKAMAGFYQPDVVSSNVYELYEKELVKQRALDFDDLIIKACDILREHKNIRTKWNHRFKYILVDEFQDTNDMQYSLIKLLMNDETELFIVGDPDQTIYTWRGANVNLILDFEKNFKGARDFILKENYRSTKAILDGANSLISFNKKRLPKDLITNNEQGKDIVYYHGKSQETEANWVCERILDLKSNIGVKYQDIAILYRSNFYSRAIEDQLIKHKIPYSIYGGVRFFDRKEIKDAIAYLRLIVNNKDDLAFERIINVPRRKIGNKAIEMMQEGANRENCSLYEYCINHVDEFKRYPMLESFIEIIEQAKDDLADENCVYSNLLNEVMNKTGYYKMCEEEQEEERNENIRELINLLFIRQGEGVQGITLDEIIQDIMLYSAQDEMNDQDKVILMTIHTAKGLEFPYVFIVGLSEGVFPAAKTILENKDGIEEERRLAYVAFTRAEKRLYLADSEGYSFATQSFRVTSRFINEVSNHIKPYFGGVTIKSVEPKGKPKPTTTITRDDFVNKNDTYRPGMMVEHRAFGEGVVIAVDKDSVTVAFKNPAYGKKQIAKSFAGMNPR